MADYVSNLSMLLLIALCVWPAIAAIADGAFVRWMMWMEVVIIVIEYSVLVLVLVFAG